MRVETRSCKRWPGSRAPRHCHSPCTRSSAPVSRPWRTTSRRYERVAGARLPQEVERRALDRAVERGGHERFDLGSGQRLQRDQRRGSVLPQRDDGVGGGLPAAQRRHHRGGAAAGKQRNERGRRVVEQVRVVDTEDQPATVPFGLQRADDRPQRAVASPAEGLGGNEMGDCAERNRGGGLSGGHPLGAVAVAARPAREPRARVASCRHPHHR